MRASDDEQGINKLRPKGKQQFDFIKRNVKCQINGVLIIFCANSRTRFF